MFAKCVHGLWLSVCLPVQRKGKTAEWMATLCFSQGSPQLPLLPLDVAVAGHTPVMLMAAQLPQTTIKLCPVRAGNSSLKS